MFSNIQISNSPANYGVSRLAYRANGKYDLTQLPFLIVEKHLPMSSMLRGMLRELGVSNVYDAFSPEAGFEEFNHHLPDVVLVDWAPGFDGLGLLKKFAPMRRAKVLLHRSSR